MSEPFEPKVVLKPRYEGEDIKKQEAVLRKRNTNLARAAERVAKQTEARKKLGQEKKSTVEAPHVIVRGWKRMNVDRKRVKHLHTQQLPKDMLEAPCLLAVRNLREGGTQQTNLALKSMKLTRFNQAVILPNNPAMRSLLQLVEPFVYFGYPTRDIVHKLFERRGALEIDGKAVPVVDNSLVEEHLGNLGFICVEDVVDAVWTGHVNGAKALEKYAPFEVADLKKAEGMKAADVEQGNLKKGINRKLATVLG